MAYDADNPRKVGKRERRAKAAQRQAESDLAQLLKVPAFRRFVHARLERCHIWMPSYRQGDPMHTAFQEGERNIGLELFANCEEAAPLETALMIAEAGQAKASEKAIQKAEEVDDEGDEAP